MCDLPCGAGRCEVIAERNSSICVCNEGVRQSLEFALPDHVYRCAVRDIRCLPCDTSDVGLDAVYSLALIVVIFAFPTIFMSLRVEDHWRYHIPAVVSCLCALVACSLKIGDKSEEFGFSSAFTFFIFNAMGFWAVTAFFTLNLILKHLMLRYQYTGDMLSKVETLKKVNKFVWVPLMLLFSQTNTIAIVNSPGVEAKYAIMIFSLVSYLAFAIYFMLSIYWVLSVITRDLRAVSVTTQTLKGRVERGLLKIQVSKKTMMIYGVIFVTLLALVICIPPVYPYNKYFAGLAMFAIGGLTIVKYGLDIYWERSNGKSETEDYVDELEQTPASEGIVF